MRLNGMKYMRK